MTKREAYLSFKCWHCAYLENESGECLCGEAESDECPKSEYDGMVEVRNLIEKAVNQNDQKSNKKRSH